MRPGPTPEPEEQYDLEEYEQYDEYEDPDRRRPAAATAD